MVLSGMSALLGSAEIIRGFEMKKVRGKNSANKGWIPLGSIKRPKRKSHAHLPAEILSQHREAQDELDEHYKSDDVVTIESATDLVQDAWQTIKRALNPSYRIGQPPVTSAQIKAAETVLKAAKKLDVDDSPGLVKFKLGFSDPTSQDLGDEDGENDKH